MSSRTNGAAASTHEVDVILNRVGRHFNELLAPDANPLEVALALMDSSSIGKARHADEFEHLKRDLKLCLKRQVDANYQGFNSSVGMYHSVVDGINESHTDIVDIKTDLTSVRSLLAQRRPVLKELQQTSLKYKKLLELLDIVESLKEVPDKTEALIAHKRFVDAHLLLSSSLETMVNRDILKFAAIQPIHSYIVAQQGGLYKMLVDELAAHLYLRSPYTLSRWTNYDDKKIEMHRLDDAIETSPAKLQEFLETVQDPLLPHDPNQSAEEDSFRYIRQLVETLIKLDRLEPALEAIQSTVVVDVRRLVDKTISEFIKKRDISPESVSAVPRTLLEELEVPEHESRLRILEALTKTVYSKLIAVLEGHRVVLETVTHHSSVAYDIGPACRAVESETRSLLINYIDDGPGPRPRGRSFSSINSGRSGLSKQVARSENAGPKFRFTPQTSYPDIDGEFEELRASMKRWVPGLGVSVGDIDDSKFTPYADTHKESNLSVVAPANVLNIRAMAVATAQLCEKARRVIEVPETTELQALFSGFLGEFLSATFFPRLKTAIEHSFEEILQNDDSTEVAKGYHKLSQLPIMEAVNQFVRMITRLCVLLNAGTSFRDSYSGLLVGLIEIIQDFFEVKIKEHTCSSRNSNRDKVVAVVSTMPPLQNLDSVLRSSEGDSYHEALDKEVEFYLDKRYRASRATKALTLNDVLDIDSFRFLALLSTSMQWTILRLKTMLLTHKESETKPDDTSSSNSVVLSMEQRWVTSYNASTENRETETVRAYLSGPAVSKFRTIMQSIEEMSENTVEILRADVMLHIVYYFDQMGTLGNYFLTSSENDQDSYIEILQRHVSSCYQIANDYLVPARRVFIFAGASKLMNELLIHESENVPRINESGVRKIFASLFGLQQVLKSVATSPVEVDFSRAVEFYESLRKTPTRILDSARSRDTSLTENDIRLLLGLKHKEELAKNDNRDEMTLGNAYNDNLATLRKIFQAGAR